MTAGRRDGVRFVLRLNNGEDFVASAVIVACGLTGMPHIPESWCPLAPEGPDPAGLLSHISQHQDLARYAGRQVAVTASEALSLSTLIGASSAPCPRRTVSACNW